MNISKYLITFILAPVGLFVAGEAGFAFMSAFVLGTAYHIKSSPDMIMSEFFNSIWIYLWLFVGGVGCFRLLLKDMGQIR